MKEIISTDKAASAVGAYSQGTTNGDLLFTAGQIGLTPDGDLLGDEDIETQTTQALDNLTAIIEEAGGSLDDVLKTTVFLADIDDFDAMNEVYGSYFDDEPPARSAIQAGGLPANMDVEIEAVVTSGVRGRTKSALLWGVVGALAFLVAVQGYQLAVGGVALSLLIVAAVAIGVAAVAATVAYVAEPRLLTKGRS